MKVWEMVEKVYTDESLEGVRDDGVVVLKQDHELHYAYSVGDAFLNYLFELSYSNLEHEWSVRKRKDIM